jgi:hypothetical protein
MIDDDETPLAPPDCTLIVEVEISGYLWSGATPLWLDDNPLAVAVVFGVAQEAFVDMAVEAAVEADLTPPTLSEFVWTARPGGSGVPEFAIEEVPDAVL